MWNHAVELMRNYTIACMLKITAIVNKVKSTHESCIPKSLLAVKKSETFFFMVSIQDPRHLKPKVTKEFRTTNTLWTSVQRFSLSSWELTFKNSILSLAQIWGCPLHVDGASL